MDQGAWGISFGLDYVPSRYATTDELCDVVNIIKRYDAVSAAHLRHYIGIPESTAEFCEVGRRTGAKIQISHLASNSPESYDIALKATARGPGPHRRDSQQCGPLHPARSGCSSSPWHSAMSSSVRASRGSSGL